MNTPNGHQYRDPSGDLLTPGHGAVSLARIDDLTADICRDRQAQIESGIILIEDLRGCGLTRDESRALGLLAAGWNIGEAAGIMGVSRSTAQRAVRSMQGKVRPLLSIL